MILSKIKKIDMELMISVNILDRVSRMKFTDCIIDEQLK